MELDYKKCILKVNQCILLTGLGSHVESSTYVVHVKVIYIAVRTPLYIVYVLQSIKVYVKDNLSQGMHASVCMLQYPW